MENDTKEEAIPFRFKVSGDIIKRFGEESLSNKNVAILELIKNSYDAGAKRVEILFKHEDTLEHSEIIIKDDGHGMGSEDIENKWMNIASSHKRNQQIKKNQRVPVGEKGLGRLSVESLGKKTVLVTNLKGESKGYKVFFDWEKYQQKGVYVSEIVNKGFSFTIPKKIQGTSLEISELRHDWGEEKTQKDLLTDIYLLNPPNKTPSGFKVVAPFHRYLKDFKKIKKSFLNNAAYSLKIRLTKGSLVKYEFSNAHGRIKKGTLHLERKLECGDVVFELFFYYRTINAYKNGTGKELSFAEMKEINTTLDTYQGIKLYRDNFRVKPYGEPSNDWLGLEVTAQYDTMCPRNNSIFGMVHISKSKNPQITDTTTREGVILTDEFRDLMNFVKTSITGLFIDLRSEEESFKKKARKSPKVDRDDEVVSKKKKATLKIPESTTKEIKDEKLIDAKGDYPQSFYYPLEQEINDCYQSGYPNATIFLCRKIMENLLFNILEKKFPDEKNLWWSNNPENSTALSFSALLKNLYATRKRFKPNVKTYIDRINPLLKGLRNKVNPTSHNIFDYLQSKEEVKKLKIADSIQLLLNIWNNLE